MSTCLTLVENHADSRVDQARSERCFNLVAEPDADAMAGLSAELDRLEELLAKATPGPWRPCIGSGLNLCTAVVHSAPGRDTAWVADFFPRYMQEEGDGRETHLHDMELVLAMRAALPLLIEIARGRTDADDGRGA